MNNVLLTYSVKVKNLGLMNKNLGWSDYVTETYDKAQVFHARLVNLTGRVTNDTFNGITPKSRSLYFLYQSIFLFHKLLYTFYI